MAKKSNSLSPQASEVEIYFVGKKGIKIYPVYERGKWFIEVDNNNSKTRFPKSIKQAEINESLALTTKFYYNKLKELKR